MLTTMVVLLLGSGQVVDAGPAAERHGQVVHKAGPGGPSCLRRPAAQPGHVVEYCCPAGQGWVVGPGYTGCEDVLLTVSRVQAERDGRLEAVRVIDQLSAARGEQSRLADEAAARAAGDERTRATLAQPRPVAKKARPTVSRTTAIKRTVAPEPKDSPYDDPWDVLGGALQTPPAQRTVLDISQNVILRIDGVEIDARTVVEAIRAMAADIEALKVAMPRPTLQRR
jgi:hypothetical protein